jgi:hypothetical protein
MQSVPRDLEDLVGRIAHAAEAMYPDLTVTWLPDAAGEQFVFMLSRAGGSGEIRVRWKTLRGGAPEALCTVLTSKLPTHRQIFRGSVEGEGDDLRLQWKEGVA